MGGGHGPGMGKKEKRKWVKIPQTEDELYLRKKANQWALKQWPPDPLGDHDVDPSTNEAHQALCRIHHLLLYSSITFDDAMRILGQSSQNSPTASDVLSTLHLFIAYHHLQRSKTQRDTVFDILRRFERLYPSIKPTRQTLHLLCLHYLHPLAISGDVTRQQVNTTIDHFRTVHSVSPGLETLRLIMTWCCRSKDRGLAKKIWLQWWEEFERQAKRLDSFESGLDTVEPREITFKFGRIGLYAARWLALARRLEKKGWIVEVSDQEENGLFTWNLYSGHE